MGIKKFEEMWGYLPVILSEIIPGLFGGKIEN